MCPEGMAPRVSTPAESLSEVNGWKTKAPTSSLGRERPTTRLITDISRAESATEATSRVPERRIAGLPVTAPTVSTPRLTPA